MTRVNRMTDNLYMNSATSPAAPKVHTDAEYQALDLLTSYPVAEVRGRDLRAGMVLVDDLDSPVAGIDHKTGRAADGAIPFLVEDLENGGWRTVRLGQNARFRVIAA